DNFGGSTYGIRNDRVVSIEIYGGPFFWRGHEGNEVRAAIRIASCQKDRFHKKLLHPTASLFVLLHLAIMQGVYQEGAYVRNEEPRSREESWETLCSFSRELVTGLGLY